MGEVMTLETLQQLQRIEDLLIKVECTLSKLEWLGDQDKEPTTTSAPPLVPGLRL